MNPIASVVLLGGIIIVECALSVYIGGRLKSRSSGFLVAWVVAIVLSVLFGLIYARIVDGPKPPPTPPGEMGFAVLLFGTIVFWGPLSGLIAAYVVFKRNRRANDDSPPM